MRFGLNALLYTVSFSADDLDLIARVADIGYDGIELPFIDLDSLDPAPTRRALEAAGMEATGCATLVPGANLVSGEAAERAAGLARLKRCVDIAAEMGIEAVAGPLYAPVGFLTGSGRTDDEWQRAIDGLRAAAEYAGGAGVVLAIEPLNRFETYFLNTAADALALVEAVDHPALSVQLDTFHANIEEKDTPAAIRLLGGRLGHFHACENDRGQPGTGQVPWDDVFAALSDVGYDGWVVIETFARGIRDLCAAAFIWRDIYDSADGLARDGLAFLKQKAAAA